MFVLGICGRNADTAAYITCAAMTRWSAAEAVPLAVGI